MHASIHTASIHTTKMHKYQWGRHVQYHHLQYGFFMFFLQLYTVVSPRFFLVGKHMAFKCLANHPGFNHWRTNGYLAARNFLCFSSPGALQVPGTFWVKKNTPSTGMNCVGIAACFGRENIFLRKKNMFDKRASENFHLSSLLLE